MMKKTNILLILAAALALSSSHVAAMKRQRDFQQDDDCNPKDKKPRLDDSQDYADDMAYLADQEEAAVYGNETKRVIVLEGQLQSLTDMIGMIDEVAEFISTAGNLDMAFHMVTSIYEMLAQITDIDFSGEPNLDPLTVDKESDLKLFIGRKIKEIREKATALVEVVNANNQIKIADTSEKAQQQKANALLGTINMILTILGCDQIEMHYEMNTSQDNELREKAMAEYLANEVKLEERSRALVRQLSEQDGPQQMDINDDEDPEFVRALALSLQNHPAPQNNKKDGENCIIS